MRQGNLAALTARGFLACLVLVFGTGYRVYGQKGRHEVGEGNRQFQAGEFEKARESYRRALGKAPGSPVATFNLGDSNYKLSDFSDAETAFLEAIQSENSEVAAGAHYNLGNSLFRQGRIEESAEAFKQALRLNPNDREAKHNLEFVLKQKQKQQQAKTAEENREGQEDQEQQSGQPSEDGKNPDRGSDQPEQSEESSDLNAQPEQDNQEQRNQAPENQSEPHSDDGDAGQPPQPHPGRLTKEEASRLLEALQEDLQSLRREQLKKLKRTGVEKDW